MSKYGIKWYLLKCEIVLIDVWIVIVWVVIILWSVKSDNRKLAID